MQQHKSNANQADSQVDQYLETLMRTLLSFSPNTVHSLEKIKSQSQCYVNWQFDWLLEFVTTNYDSAYKFDYVTVTGSHGTHMTKNHGTSCDSLL